MTREFAGQFNEEVEHYRRALVYFSRKSEWEEFREMAGRLFEYLENVEAVERERRFYTLFYRILTVIAFGVVVALGLDSQAMHTGLLDFRQPFFIVSLAGCGFELFFYLNFRWYVEARMAGFQRRRAAFIRNLVNDFRSFQEA